MILGSCPLIWNAWGWQHCNGYTCKVTLDCQGSSCSLAHCMRAPHCTEPTWQNRLWEWQGKAHPWGEREGWADSGVRPRLCMTTEYGRLSAGEHSDFVQIQHRERAGHKRKHFQRDWCNSCCLRPVPLAVISAGRDPGDPVEILAAGWLPSQTTGSCGASAVSQLVAVSPHLLVSPLGQYLHW